MNDHGYELLIRGGGDVLLFYHARGHDHDLFRDHVCVHACDHGYDDHDRDDRVHGYAFYLSFCP